MPGFYEVDMRTNFSDFLWGHRAKFSYLIFAAAILLLTMLGAREIWTQEHRWADIVFGMFYRHDFLHPFLDTNSYYDKPLLSYWFIAFFTWITGQLSLWSMRLPSALAGLLAIFSIYRLGSILKDKRLGLLAGWLLLTSFYFIFWARTTSADMLNMAGALFAVTWYSEKRDQPSFFNYMVFFLVLALTSLCKGLVGAVVALLAIFPDLLVENHWKRHLRFSFILAIIPAAIVYVVPFWASSHFGNSDFHDNGLYQVYRENVLRYLAPFDHKGPIYTYFIFLPVYLLPWAFFFIPALFSLKSRWSTMSANSKWMVWATLILFIFFTLSGSRRNYYVLAMVPFAILMTADWILAHGEKSMRYQWAGKIALIFFIALFSIMDVIQPLFYAGGRLPVFANELKIEATQIKPWSEWQVVMLDAESKVRFYLQLAPDTKAFNIKGEERKNQTLVTLKQTWPILQNKKPNEIFITRKRYVPFIKNELANYQMVESRPGILERIFKFKNQEAPVAFIPKERI